MKKIPALLYLISLILFVIGLFLPLMHTEVAMGYLGEESVYMLESVGYFFRKGESFLGMLILLFSIVFPILKYLVVGLQILQVRFGGDKILRLILEIINKWAMLDVYVVAMVIVSMKLGSSPLTYYMALGWGTTAFAVSIVLLMVCTFILKKMSEPAAETTPESSNLS